VVSVAMGDLALVRRIGRGESGVFTICGQSSRARHATLTL
jgi:hypothetical protein